MEEVSDENDLFDEVDVRGSESFEENIILNDGNEPSPGPDNKLDEMIQHELDFLEGQLEKITLKLKTNYDSLILKQTENEEMRKVIEFYSLNTDTRSPKASSCNCSTSCFIH